MPQVEGAVDRRVDDPPALRLALRDVDPVAGVGDQRRAGKAAVQERHLALLTGDHAAAPLGGQRDLQQPAAAR
jgi:hypothetical protein